MTMNYMGKSRSGYSTQYLSLRLDSLPNLAGEDGDRLVDLIWAELTDVLRREVPEVEDVLKSLNADL
jgi:hypothetical protein